MKSNRHTSRRLNRSLLTCALASCMAMATPQVLAQSANATLRGQVTGASAPTEVTATNTKTGAVRRTQSAANGSYTIVGLDPGTYTVEAGPGTAQTVTVSVASTATLNIGSASATGSDGATNLDTVTVTAPPLLQEVKTSEVGKTISLHQIQTTPQISRNFLEFADAVPGMTFTSDANGRTKLVGGGQNASSTNVYIDGVGQKSYVKEGGIAGSYNSSGNPFPQLAIGEYKVITSNYKAEYGQISSAAVTAATKSGTNEFHGEAFYRYTDDDMRSKTVAEKQPGKEKAVSASKEYGFAIGGPIIQDRMHFFLTYEAKRFNLPTTIVPDNGAQNAVKGLPASAAALLGPGSQPFQEDLLFGKIDWEITDNDRLEFSGQDRDEDQEAFSGSDSREHGTTTKNTDRRFAFRWEHSGERYYNELLFTHEDSFNNPLPLTLGNGYIYTTPDINNLNNDATIIQTGGASPLSAQRKGQKGASIEDNLTLNSFTWHGDHTIKMGVRYKDIDLYAADAADINPQFQYSINSSFTDQIPYRGFFTKPVTGLGGLTPSVKSSDKQYGLYIQDDWAVNDKLVLNLGVRWDYEKNPAYLDFVTPANVVAALNSQDPSPDAPAGQTYAQSLAKGGIDVNDYISTGDNRKAFDGAWQPRLGFSYDLNADEQHVFHGGAGRSYDRDLFDYLQLEKTKSALPQFTVYFRDPNSGQCYRGSVPCFDWNPDYLNGLGNLQQLVGSSNAGVEVDLLNNKLKAPYSDQFSFGMSNQIGDWLTDATVSRVLSYDGFAFTLGQRYPNGDFFQNGSQPWGNGVPGFGALIVGNNGIETHTTQVLLSAQKPYTKESGWGSSFAYTFTHASQNRDINEHYSFDEGTIGDYPFIHSNAAARHRFVITGSYDAFWGISLGGKLTLATPVPSNGFLQVPLAGPNTSTNLPASATASGNGRFLIGGKAWGFRTLDLQATKDFKFGDSFNAYVKLNVINVLNFENYSDINVVTKDGRLVASYREDGAITGQPRTVYAEAGFRF